jgi:hypothetical protein
MLRSCMGQLRAYLNHNVSVYRRSGGGKREGDQNIKIGERKYIDVQNCWRGLIMSLGSVFGDLAKDTKR